MTTELVNQQAPAIRSMDDLARMAEMFARSGYFKDSKDAAQAGVRIMCGLESGFGPFAAMTGVHVIQGKPTFGANLMAVAIKRSGRYNYRVSEHSDKLCRIEFFERWDSKWEPVGESSFSIEDAQRAGLMSNPTWKNYPRNILFSRAISNGLRWYCPDALSMTAYTPEELGAQVDGEGNVLKLPDAPEVPAQASHAPEMVTPKQLTALGIAVKEAGFATTEDGKVQGRAFLGWLAGVDGLGSSKDLTKEQAQRALDRLGEGENGSYRTNKAKVDKAFQDYAEYQAGQQFEREQPEREAA